jgi:hypothetical protein
MVTISSIKGWKLLELSGKSWNILKRNLMWLKRTVRTEVSEIYVEVYMNI